MAELAVGAVTSLLGLIRNEALLLGNLGSDVQFIKEEMESMNSFLKHLAKTAPRGEPDEQVRTWMKQVRELAHDCSNCIDLYLQRGNPASHRYYSTGSLLQRLVCWAPWMVDKLLAQHYAANRLRELRRRAHDVGQRRLRYGVEIPKQPPAGISSTEEAAAPVVAAPSAAAAQDDDDDDDGEEGHYDEDEDSQDDEGGYEAEKTTAAGRRALDPRSLDDYCAHKIVEWLDGPASAASGSSCIPSMAIVAPDAAEVTASNARDALAFVAITRFKRSVWINLLNMHKKEILEILPYSVSGRRRRFFIRRFRIVQNLPAKPSDILCYVLRECVELNKHHKDHGEVQEKNVREQAYQDMANTLREIRASFPDDQLKKKIEDIESRITASHGKEAEENKAEETTSHGQQQQAEENKAEDVVDYAHWTNKPLGILFRALTDLLLKQQGETTETKGVGETNEWLMWGHEKIVTETANKLKQYVERAEPETTLPIHLDQSIYGHVLLNIFPANKHQQTQHVTDDTPHAAAGDTDATSSGNVQVKEIVHKIKQDILQDILRELQQQQLPQPPQEAAGKPVKQEQEQATPTKPGHHQEDEYYANVINETKRKIAQIQTKIKEHVTMQKVVDKISEQLKSEKTLIIIEDDGNYVTDWADIRNALNPLSKSGSAMIITTRNTQRAKEICHPSQEPITNTIVSLYCDILLQLTRKSVNKDARQIFHDILDRCYPNEFSMKIFAHALYANPNRSNDHLCKLLGSLKDSQKSSGRINARKMIKFSYDDLRKEYKSCLLYLAIFPPGYPIRRSALVGRWVTEGLIAKDEWPSAVHHAERCFEALINRWLVYPSDVGDAGKVKTCIVGDLVHEFITKIAKKQHIVEPRLSHHLARHFSIFNDVRLRGSDGVNTFLRKLRGSSELSMLKVLDLEGCLCFKGNQYYLKDICNNILLLKYLSLRGTDITQLPREINNLYELEVLDISQTKVPAYATRHVLLLKLKRLLAGHTDLASSTNGMTDSANSDKVPLCSSIQKRNVPLFSGVQVPHKIRKMANLEVLYKVKASRSGKELKDIGKLWNLRKLGVVIDDKDNVLKNLLTAISDLCECLRSLSISIVPYTRSDVPSNGDYPKTILRCLRFRPKLLESISIHGYTHNGQLLALLAEGISKLSKVTLSRTSLEQGNLKVLSELPNLRYFRLRHNGYTDEKLTFKKDEFKRLKSFLVEGSNMISIKFKNEAATELEKIVLSSTNIKSLSGLGDLPKLKELEMKRNRFLVSFSEELETQNKYTRSILTFKKDKFQKLKYLLVEGPNMETDITFEVSAARELEKVVLSFANIMSISGANNLLKFKQLELKGNKSLLLSSLENARKVLEVTLHSTWLDRSNLQILGKKPRIRCLVLSQHSYDESQLIFNNNEFPELAILIVKCSGITEIQFTDRSAPKLEKIVWSFTKMISLSGITNLPKLKELELTGDHVPDQVRDDIKAHRNQPVLTRGQLQYQDQDNGRAQEDTSDARFPTCSWLLKNKYWPAAGQNEDFLPRISYTLPSFHDHHLPG